MTMTSPLSAQTTSAAIEFLTAQPTNQSLARVFIGSAVKNADGLVVGDINDLLFDKAGAIKTVSIGVGGFLGIGEKTVAVPFSALTMSVGADGEKTIVLDVSKAALDTAPSFVATEKTTMDAVHDRAVDLGQKTAVKANELKDQAAKAIGDMTRTAPGKK